MVAGWWPEFGASPALEATTADHAVLDAVEFIRTTRHRRGDWIPEQTTPVRDGQQVTVSVEVDAFAGDMWRTALRVVIAVRAWRTVLFGMPGLAGRGPLG